MGKPTVVITGPALDAVSGVSTHLNQLLGSDLQLSVNLVHFQVGTEGRQESAVQKIMRLSVSPIALSWCLLRARAHVVHLNTSMDLKGYWRDLAYLLLSRLLGRKVVYQVHGGALPQEFLGHHPLVKRFLRWSLRRPDVVVLLAAVELSAYRDFVPQQRLELVANAVDIRAVGCGRRDASKQQLFRIAYLGRLTADKGVFEAIAAVGILHSEGRRVTLTIAGTGAMEDKLRQQVADMNLSEIVRFEGQVFGRRKQDVLEAAHVLVLPSRREGLPYSLLEAMGAGAVPVATPVGGIPDVMRDGEHGLLVAPGDVMGLARALARLDDDRALLKRMSTASQARIREAYSVDRVAASFRDIYQSLLG